MASGAFVKLHATHRRVNKALYRVMRRRKLPVWPSRHAKCPSLSRARRLSKKQHTNNNLSTVAPQPPIIEASTALAREGQEYALRCMTQGGNPEPNITWFRNELPVGPGGARIVQERVGNLTTSTLAFVPTIDDHHATYKCRVWNKAMDASHSFEREFKVQVECKYF